MKYTKFVSEKKNLLGCPFKQAVVLSEIGGEKHRGDHRRSLSIWQIVAAL